jgi:hypothetical protein
VTVYRYWEFHLKSLSQLTGAVPVLLAIACLVWRYGGIHFKTADVIGRAAGRVIGLQAWAKAKNLWEDSPPPGRHRENALTSPE